MAIDKNTQVRHAEAVAARETLWERQRAARRDAKAEAAKPLTPEQRAERRAVKAAQPLTPEQRAARNKNAARWRLKNPDYAADRYEREKDQRAAYYTARRADPATLVGQKRALVEARKAGQRCHNCQRDDVARLEFVHRNPATRAAYISAMVMPARYSIADLEAELDKCSILCASCRRIRSRREREAGYHVDEDARIAELFK